MQSLKPLEALNFKRPSLLPGVDDREGHGLSALALGADDLPKPLQPFHACNCLLIATHETKRL